MLLQFDPQQYTIIKLELSSDYAFVYYNIVNKVKREQSINSLSLNLG